MQGSVTRRALSGFVAWAMVLFWVPWSIVAAQVPEGPPGSRASTLEDPPAPFEPRTPRTAEQQRRVEALTDFVAARSLEEQKRFKESLGLLEKARQVDPESPPVLRALSRVSFALGRIEQAIEFSKRLVEADPTDVGTLKRLVLYHTAKFEPASAEAVLKQALANPKLPKLSPAYLVIHRDLGELYSRSLNQREKAADCFAVVLEGLDDKATAKFTALDQKLVLGDQPEGTYELFGDAFFLVNRFELAVRAYRRGLAYDPDDTELPLRLTEALLRNGQKTEALATLEPLLKDKPEGREPYELLSQTLTALDRKAEVIPRLEKALEGDSKNVGLKFVLADRYKEAGQLARANELYEGLAKVQPDPQGFAALAQSLRKERKYDDLIKLFERALGAPTGRESLAPQIEALCLDKETAAAVLDAGLALLTQDPPGLNRLGQSILVYIANRSEQVEKLITLERLALKRNPNPMGYRELWLGLYRANRFDEAVQTMEEMLAKFPDEADVRNQNILSQTHIRAGQFEQALESARRALKLNPNDVDGMSLEALALTKLGKYDEAIAQYKRMLERFGDNEEVVKQARSGLSNAYVEMGDLDNGQKELEVLFARMPDDPGINNDLGYLYADRGQKLEEAERMIRKALEDEPDNGSFLDSLGWVLYRRGKFEEALVPLEKAAKIQAGDATIFDHLGDVYFRLRETAKARTSWEKAEALMSKSVPPDKKLPDVRRKLDALKQQPVPPNTSNDNP